MSNQEPLSHATITTARPTVHAQHPFKNATNHERLLQYIRRRLQLGKADRDARIPRLIKIDQGVAGWIKLSQDDIERQRVQDRTGVPQAITMNLPLGFIHLDDMMTYFAETFAPNRGMFSHTGRPDETSAANQIVTLMNNHAIYGSYYRHILLTIFSILKYNVGGAYAFWSEDYGPKIETEGGRVTVTDQKIWEGNRFEALDMYNTVWDPTVSPITLHRDGEFAARFFMRSHYWLASRAAKGVYFNCDQALDHDNGMTQAVYYRSPPAESKINSDESAGGRVDWIGILSAAPDYVSASGFEIAELLIRINPNDFGLVAESPRDRNQYELWRITLLNDQYIIETTQLTNAHGQIPFYFGHINDDVMGEAAKSPAEVIQPLQNFASTLLNSHVLANRKNLWGVTWYDPTIFNFDEIPPGEVAGYVKIKPAGFGKDLTHHIYRDSGMLDTKQTLGDLKDILDVTNMFYPTQAMPSQVASIDRAVTSQVAAVQQGSNRRQHKAARLLDDTLFRPARACMFYNIIQYQPDNAQVSDFTGRVVTINLEELRQTDMPFIIGQGLKAIDRMMIADKLQSIIFAIIQSQQASQQTDILKMIDYWTNMIDIDLDFSQFRLQAPTLPPGAEATPGTVSATNQSITPMTNPAAVTEPLRG